MGDCKTDRDVTFEPETEERIFQLLTELGQLMNCEVGAIAKPSEEGALFGLIAGSPELFDLLDERSDGDYKLMTIESDTESEVLH
jgi:hypothetical protein